MRGKKKEKGVEGKRKEKEGKKKGGKKKKEEEEEEGTVSRRIYADVSRV